VILQQIRTIVHEFVPQVQELISYQIPAFKLNGMLVYFAAFKKYIGFYPPVRGDEILLKAIAPKGNLQFPLNQPIPYALIRQIVAWHIQQNLAKKGVGF
jgi:uncharacterized protein YdhG (YjbR/CyaY superfamily)